MFKNAGFSSNRTDEFGLGKKFLRHVYYTDSVMNIRIYAESKAKFDVYESKKINTGNEIN